MTMIIENGVKDIREDTLNKLTLCLIVTLLSINIHATKVYKLAKVNILNNASEKMLEKEDFMLEVNDKNQIQKVYINGYPIRVNLHKLETNGSAKILRVKVFGIHVVDLKSNNFTLNKGGKMNVSFNAVEGVKDNHNITLKYNQARGKWLIYHNGRIVTKIVARMDIDPGTSVIKILGSSPKVEHSYFVY